MPLRFVTGAGVSSLGTGLFAACATLFFVGRVGFSAPAVGAALSAGAAVGLMAAPCVGLLADRLGVRPVLTGLLLLRGLAYGGLAAAHRYPEYALLVIIGLAGDQATPPLQQTLVGALAGADRRTEAQGVLRAVRNIGLTGGFLVGGLVLELSSALAVRAVLLANGLSFAVLAAVVSTLRPAEPATRPPRTGSPAALRSPRLLGLTVGNGLLALHDSILFVALPLWVLARGDLPLGLAPWLLAVNTALTVGLQLWLPRTAAGREWRRGLRAAAALLVVACCLFAVTSWLGPVSAAAVAVVAVVALTGGENAHAVAAWELSYAVAPPGRTAEYLTVFGLSLGLAGLLGPIVLAGPVLGGGPVGWLLLAVLFGAGAVLVRRCGEALLRVRVAPGAG